MRSRRSISLVVILLVINYTLEVSAPPPPRPRTAESHAKRPSPAYDDYPPLLTVQGPPPGSTPYKGVNKDAPVPKVHTDETLIFEDDFNQFDLSVWEHEITLGGGGNWEFQYYTNNRTNSYVRDGILYLRPTLTSNRIGEHNVQDGFRMDMWGNSPANMCTGNQFYGCERMSAGSSGGNIINPIQSARVRTAQAVNVRYGRVEVRAMLPKGDWLWPAIWMLPRWNQYGDWPASGEIDIMESKGNAPSYDEGSNVFYSTLHWGPDWSQNLFNLTHAKCRKASGSFSDEFHTFGAYWDDKELYTYLDTEDNKVLHIKFDMPFYTRGGWKTFDNPWKNAPNSAPFDQDFFLILNVAVGGVSDFFPDNVGRKPWKDSDPHAVNAFYADKARVRTVHIMFGWMNGCTAFMIVLELAYALTAHSISICSAHSP